jgi:hydroxymethylbilane synthase
LHRLDLLKDIPHTQKLSLDMMIPPMGQAALGIEIVSTNALARKVAQFLNDEETFLCTQIEREFISEIGAGCSAPVACNAVSDGTNIVFRTMIGFSDGSNIMSQSVTVAKEQAEQLGVKVAQEMIANGALELLQKAQESAFKDEMPQRL